MLRPEFRWNLPELAGFANRYLERQMRAARAKRVRREDWPLHVYPGANRALGWMLRRTIVDETGERIGGVQSEPRVWKHPNGHIEVAYLVRLHLLRGETAWSADHDPDGLEHVLLWFDNRPVRQAVDREAGEDASWTLMLQLETLEDPILRGSGRTHRMSSWMVANHHTEPLLRRMLAELEESLANGTSYGTPVSLLFQEIQDRIYAHEAEPGLCELPMDRITSGTVRSQGMHRWRVKCHTERSSGTRHPSPYVTDISWELRTGCLLLEFHAPNTSSGVAGIPAPGA